MNFLFLAFQVSLSLSQSIGCLGFLFIFTSFGLTTHRKFNREDAEKWSVVTVALVAMIYTGSKALQFLSVPVYTIFKNLTIILTAFLERTVLKGSAITPLIMTSFVLMVLSSIVAGYADAAEQQFNVEGYTWMLFNSLSSAGYTLMMKSKIKSVNFKDYDTVYFNSITTLIRFIIDSNLVGHVFFH